MPMSTRRETRSEIKWCNFNFSRGHFIINKILWNRYPFLNLFNDYNLKLSLWNRYPFLNLFNDYNLKLSLVYNYCSPKELIQAPSLYWLRRNTTHLSIKRFVRFKIYQSICLWYYYIILKHVNTSIKVYKITKGIIMSF